MRYFINRRNNCTPFGVDAGAVIPGIDGDALGGIVVPVDVGIMRVAVVPVGSVVDGGAVITVDSVDG